MLLESINDAVRFTALVTSDTSSTCAIVFLAAAAGTITNIIK